LPISFGRAARFVQANCSETARRVRQVGTTHPSSFLLACEHGDVNEVTTMTTVILLISLLTPNHLEQYASELLVPDQTEPRCDEIERMFAKFDADFRVEEATARIDAIFGE
jgi:hypothetical protein